MSYLQLSAYQESIWLDLPLFLVQLFFICSRQIKMTTEFNFLGASKPYSKNKVSAAECKSLLFKPKNGSQY